MKHTLVERCLQASVLFLAGACNGSLVGPVAPAQAASPTRLRIVRPRDASALEALAAKEIRRYFYLRTGELLSIDEGTSAGASGAIVVGSKDRPAVRRMLETTDLRSSVGALAAEEYRLKTAGRGSRRAVLVTGGDDVGTLYAAYRLAESLGVRFYMHGDVVPDGRIAPSLPDVDEAGKPLFRRRGIQPFHDFPEGPDWWNVDDYKAVFAQLVKMRMNFFGLHTYPEGGVGPEPGVWIGVKEDFTRGGKVKFSYPSRHFTTHSGTWGYRRKNTADYGFGAAEMFDRDDFGADYMKGMTPWPKTLEDRNEVFNRFGELLRDAFTFARRVGIKTCIGTEIPLTVPKPLREHLAAQGKKHTDPAVRQELYEGMFRRIMETHPLDYYWFWTPEGWTWGGAKKHQVDATMADFRTAIAAAKAVRAPFTLATCGWVLGPQNDRALFDNSLPKDMPMSCISRQVGKAPVETGFRRVEGRPKWSIPWLEDDPAMIIPQLWVGRMRRDAADSLAYGCTGLMGIHWRTRILGPNVSALARAAWDQSGWNPDFGREPGAKTSLPELELPEGPIGGKTAPFSQPIAGTDDDALYQTVRYDLDGYRLNVPNGTYAVTLKFCEPHYAEKGKRVFGAKIQGRKVIDRLDIFAEAGKDKALDFTFKDVKVAKGVLRIDFVRQVEFPSICAIAVEGRKAGATRAPFSRKINCAGGAHRGYEADPAKSGGDKRPRFLPADDFYDDWAASQFGPEAAGPIARLFSRLDGRLPVPATWVKGPGGLKPDGAPWAKVKAQYAFVDELAALKPRVKGAGNLERFDYWLDTFRLLRATARVRCVVGS
ncbi:MAG: malectin domain-containing carbohydrate-binding protein, partial [Planctomycetota bacterium]